MRASKYERNEGPGNAGRSADDADVNTTGRSSLGTPSWSELRIKASDR